MMENLREPVEGAVWNPKYNCYMYTWEQAQKAVPEGFHLPSPREFMDLALALGYLEKDEEVVADSFINECNFTLSGYADVAGEICNQGRNGYYWSSIQHNDDCGYILYLYGNSVDPANYHTKDAGLAVRCIKD